jgi:hypothetical protein
MAEQQQVESHPGRIDRTATQVAALQDEVDGLREAMRSRATIEQAKGMLMLRYRIDEDRAFQLLVRWSSVSQVKLKVVAATLVDMCATSPALADPSVGPEEVLAEALGTRLPTQHPPEG